MIKEVMIFLEGLREMSFRVAQKSTNQWPTTSFVSDFPIIFFDTHAIVAPTVQESGMNEKARA